MKNLLNGISLTLALALSATTSSAFASEDAYPSRVITLLNMIDGSPSAQQLMQAGVDQEGALLITVAQDKQLRRYTRARAANLMALFGKRPLVERGLLTLVDDARLDAEVQLQALFALDHVAPQRAQPRFVRLMKAKDPQRRAIAIKALAAKGRVELLRERLAGPQAESVPWVRGLIQRKLSAIQR